MRQRYCVKIIIISLILSYNSAYAASAASYKMDPELREAKKCARVIPYFEKKLHIPNGILHSIALKESGKKHSKHNFTSVWPWAVNSNGKSFYFNNKKQAVRFVQKLLRKGKNNIDVGCMQINLKSHPNAFSNIEHAFSPRRNVEYGARFLKENYAKLGNWPKAVGRYHSKNAIKAKKYQNSVTEIAKLIDVQRSNLKQSKMKKQYIQKMLISNNYNNNTQNGANNSERRKPKERRITNADRWFPERDKK